MINRRTKIWKENMERGKICEKQEEGRRNEERNWHLNGLLSPSARVPEHMIFGRIKLPLESTSTERVNVDH